MLLGVQDANQDLKNGQGRGPAAPLVRRLCSSMLEFVTALDEDNLGHSQLGKAHKVLGSNTGAS
jgi:hypothetical protein